MSLTHRLFSTRNYPIRNLSVLKCGATQVRNLFYLLDHSIPFHTPNKIHGLNDTFLRASDFQLTDADVAAEQHAFFVMRHPTRRMLSLYFDKVLGSQQLGQIRRMMMLDPLVDLDTKTVNGHLKNCFAFLDILERAMSDPDLLPRNQHWQMQTSRIGVIKQCKLKVLLLENLDQHLEILLQDIVPDIAQKLAQLRAKNASVKVVKPNDLMTSELIDRCAQVYVDDQTHYFSAVEKWALVDLETATSVDVPRLFP
jgi:hypothetical protein